MRSFTIKDSDSENPNPFRRFIIVITHSQHLPLPLQQLTATPRGCFRADNVARQLMDVDPRQIEQIAICDKDIHSIVASYLVHNCFNETAESFMASVKMKQPPCSSENMDKRKEIIRFVLEGNVPKAIKLTNDISPDLLEKSKDLYFDLLILHFVELVCSNKCTEALDFANAKLTSFGIEQKYVPKLEDTMALVAYEEPQNSPMFHLLSPDHRQQVAESLNRALLEHINQPSCPAMERLLQQATLVRQYLTQELGKELYPPFSMKDLFKI